MVDVLPRLYLVRHGNTDWADARKHTGRTDIPLNARGEERARLLGGRLADLKFSRVWTSPLVRASRTCELAGYAAQAQVDPDLVEWDYGDYEGKTSAQIQQIQSGWDIFRDGAPHGETPDAIGGRADRFISKVRQEEGNILAFSSAHMIRVIAARWLGVPANAGRYFFCATASVGILGFEHNSVREPSIQLWNDDGDGRLR